MNMRLGSTRPWRSALPDICVQWLLSTTAWTSYRSLEALRLPCLSTKTASLNVPTSYSPAASACLKQNVSGTAKCIPSLAASMFRTSQKPARSWRSLTINVIFHTLASGTPALSTRRIDTALIAEVARNRPEWQIVMLGPIVKISADTLPQAPNIHYLGMKQYSDLPAYFSSWQAAMLPFALNDATRFISPTKTPEYLAAGLPVISTPIRDVVRPYGDLGLARIAANAAEFSAAMDQMMTYSMSLKWRERADSFLSTLSWDSTWSAMNHLILSGIAERQGGLSSEPAPPLRTVAVETMDV